MFPPSCLRFRPTFFPLFTMICLAAISTPALAQFETRSTRRFPVKDASFSIATGDFNNDGKLDIAAINGRYLAVSLGNGDGTFQTPVSYSTSLTYSLSVGDFNGDGNLDIVVADFDTASVNVYLGNGDGTFKAPIGTNTTADSEVVAVGDFNHDGKLDIVVIDSPYISVLLGKGNGTFQAPIDNSSFTCGPQNLTVGDLNNDNKLDVVVVGDCGFESALGVLLGNGDGTLQSSLTETLATTPIAVAVGDFNGDGNLDVAIGDEFDLASVLLGNGKGGFLPVAYYNATQGGQIAVGDFNGDGILDLALAGIGIQPGLSVFTGNGDGTFQAERFYPAGKIIERGLALADFNGDHILDAVISDQDLGAITILNTGVASFSPTTPLIFGDQVLNTRSAPQSVTLTNSGKKTMSLTSINASAQYVVSTTCGKSLAPGAQCQISASFAPTTQGSHAGLVTVTDSASSKPQVIELLGAGTVVTFSPSSLTFASQKVGTTSPPQKVQLTNTGKTALSIAQFAMHGFDFVDFSQTNDCPASLGAGANCTITVTFTPTHTGARSAILYVNDSGGGSPQTVALAGTGS